ncbi:MFS transporter [Nonomuraea sp. JJY05]|jgi:MFS family permease|uniref:MFS transporter n=1 Tax=Nonomuraea sp. JJY05 TaxID=3350255 RepID=UPI00373EC558
MVGVLAAYAVGMAGAALAQDIAQLIAARVVQGAALAVVPLSMAIPREALTRQRLASAMGLVSGIAGAGAGLVVGGLLADRLSWRYLFVLGALPALISLGMVARCVPRGERAASGRLDVPGSLLLGLSLVAVLLALTQGPSWGWASAPVLGVAVSPYAVRALRTAAA